MSDDQSPIEIHTPGDGAEGDGASHAGDLAAQITALEAENAQLKALVCDLQEQLRVLATVPSTPVKVDTGSRLIGQDWSRMTSAEAKAAGCTQRVLCSDGYYVPGE